MLSPEDIVLEYHKAYTQILLELPVEGFRTTTLDEAEFGGKLAIAQAQEKATRKEIAEWLKAKYGGMGRGASRTALYQIAKDLSLNLTIDESGLRKG